MPRKPPDHEFKIHVDESCLSTPMEDETVAKGTTEPGIREQDVVPQDKEPDQHTETETADTKLPEQSDVGQPDIRAPSTEEEASDLVADNELKEVEDKVEEPQPETKEGEKTIEHSVAEGESTLPNETVMHALSDESFDADSEDTLQSYQMTENELQADSSSKKEITNLERKTSLRTEALIQAAARAIVTRIEKQDNRIDSSQEEEGDHSVLSHTTSETYGLGGTELSYEESSVCSHRESTNSHLNPTPCVPTSEEGEGGDSSSHHEADDDVFSDRSLRSSLGSFDGRADDERSKSPDTVQHEDAEYRRSPRVSGISNISEYENEEFVPTARGTPRPAFRTPSAVRAIQMSSPPPSVFSSPRSTKQQTGISTSGLPTISRLGSPTVSAQYSPKGRSTPPRFKSRKEAPLVLLHATLLPLRWMWGDVLNGFDNTKSSEGCEPTEQMKALRDCWRQLQDRVGDTVLERGILLPHPQNDFEILEERLLEALELPLRRRARILECGHYLGPANETTLGEDDDFDSDDELTSQFGGTRNGAKKRHWCGTCRCEIKYDELGAGKVFRVKVYASNGLMKAGAWEACWKEMERVDIEVEPIIELTVQEELEKLASLQLEEQHRREQAHTEEEDMLASQEDSFIDQGHVAPLSPPLRASPVEPSATTTTDVDADRRHLDEERFREIYGHTPPHPQQNETTSSMHPHPDSYIPPPTPPSPSEEAFERREQRRRSYQNASLPELLFETSRVVFQDRKNVVIALLSVLVLMLAVRTAPPQPDTLASQEAEILRDLYAKHQQHDVEQAAKVMVDIPSLEQPLTEGAVPVVVSARSSSSLPEAGTAVSNASSATAVRDPCELLSEGNEEAIEHMSQKPMTGNTAGKTVVKIFETVTETIKVTAIQSAVADREASEEPVETLTETVRVTYTESVAGSETDPAGGAAKGDVAKLDNTIPPENSDSKREQARITQSVGTSHETHKEL